MSKRVRTHRANISPIQLHEHASDFNSTVVSKMPWIIGRDKFRKNPEAQPYDYDKHYKQLHEANRDRN